jgi:hypothetical protein
VRILKGLWARLSEPCASKKLAACREWRTPFAQTAPLETRGKLGEPEWEELGHTPAVFVPLDCSPFAGALGKRGKGAASKELTAYGTWKSAGSIDSMLLTSEHLAALRRKLQKSA